MTRINVVPVKCLTDKHLLAEYKEITRPFNKAKKHAEAGRKPSGLSIPSKYCLGTGHETFFFNKMEYIEQRYCQLYLELECRKFNVDYNLFKSIQNELCDFIYDYGEYAQFYFPTPEDIYLNMSRLVIRSEFENDKLEIRRAFINSELVL